MFNIVYYEDDHGWSPVKEYLLELSAKDRARVLEFIKRLETGGYTLRRPTADSLGGKLGLWELRPLPHRVIYCFIHRTTIVLLHAFWKKTEKIPQKDIDLALARKEQISL